jgi:hypothetical protein
MYQKSLMLARGLLKLHHIAVINFRSEHLKRRDHAENVGIDGRIILEWILEK